MSARASSADRNAGRLAERRRLRRKRLRIALGLFALLVVVLTIVGLNQRAVRVARIDVYGTSVSLEPLIREALQGSYGFIIPRDSILFLPKQAIRNRILHAYPSIAAVSIFRSGLTSISVRVTDRTAVARWCGASYVPQTVGTTSEALGPNDCFYFDTNGFVYGTSTEATPLNDFRLYEPFPDFVVTEPGKHALPNTSTLPDVFKMARELQPLGARISAIHIHDSQVDLYAENGTRIMYVLGKEAAALSAINSSRDSVSLADGSLEYVDVRFDGKLYLKRKGASVSQ